MRGRLQKLGILRESGHEHFNGSPVIAVLNAEGEAVEMYGRKITPNHLYLPGERAGVWNEDALAVSKEIILCEALIDPLTFWVAGFRHVTACYGVIGGGQITPRCSYLDQGGTTPLVRAYAIDCPRCSC
jgi:DNA primase